MRRLSMMPVRGETNLEGSYALFVLPALVISGLVVIVPAILTVATSMTDWDGVSRPFWISLDNLRELLGDQLFWATIFNNLRWLVIFLTVPMALALVAASILLSRSKGGAVYQVILLIPFVLSPVANVGIWSNMVLDVNSGVLGYVNRTWVDLGYPLGDVNRALYTVASINIWSFWGHLAVIFTAAMRQTPE